MEGGPPRFQQDFSCPAVLRNSLRLFRIRVRGYHPVSPAFPGAFCSPIKSHVDCPTTPAKPKYCWFGLIRVRSPLLAESRLIYFPRGTEMFHFPPFATLSLYIQQRVTQTASVWVSPFGHLRIDGCLHLPVAFRSLPRPSSPPCAKASSECP